MKRTYNVVAALKSASRSSTHHQSLVLVHAAACMHNNIVGVAWDEAEVNKHCSRIVATQTSAVKGIVTVASDQANAVAIYTSLYH